MPWHLRALPVCQACGKPATCELRNTSNSSYGYFCGMHGKADLAARVREDEDRAKGVIR